MIAAEADLVKRLGVAQRIALASPQAQPNDLALTRKVDLFALRSLAFYLAVAELTLARQAGSVPQTDVQQAAQLVSQAWDEAVAAALQVERRLSVQAGLLVIQDVVWQPEAVGDHRQLRITLRNVGAQPVDDAQLVPVWGGVPQPGWQVPLIAPGQEHQMSLSLPVTRWITLQLRTPTAMPDVWVGRLAVTVDSTSPFTPAQTDTPLALDEVPQSTTRPAARPAGWLLWCLPFVILLSGLAFAVAFGLLIWLYRRANHHRW